MEKENHKFNHWLENEYLKWQQERGRRGRLVQFAKHLGISAPLLSHYLKGIRKPAGATVHKIAKQLGPEIYDVLGLQRPDPQLTFITRNWNKLTEDQRAELIDRIKKQVESNETLVKV
jgi:hypothetical protein